MNDRFNPAAVLERLRAIAGTVDVLELDEAAAVDQQRQAAERRRARLAAAAVDPEAAAAALASPRRCPRVDGHAGSVAAAQAVEAFVAAAGKPTAPRSLLLLGPTGRGKSFAATWLVAELGATWIAATECRVAGWDDLRPKAVDARVLVLDDLGREATDWSARELADVLELRHNRGRLTVATSNLPSKRLLERYGERLASRWRDPRMTVTVDVLGPDLRLRGDK